MDLDIIPQKLLIACESELCAREWIKILLIEELFPPIIGRERPAQMGSVTLQERIDQKRKDHDFLAHMQDGEQHLIARTKLWKSFLDEVLQQGLGLKTYLCLTREVKKALHDLS